MLGSNPWKYAKRLFLHAFALTEEQNLEILERKERVRLAQGDDDPSPLPTDFFSRL